MDEKASACSSCGALLLVRDTYRVVGRCGEGGMGVVYQAVDESLDRTVALKLMHARVADDARKRERFFTECKAMAKLDHPGIARIYASDRHHEQLFFVQQFVPGSSLRDLVRAEPVPLAEGCRLVMAVLAALEHAHGHGIVHRDVSPNNVLLTERAGQLEPMLIDFGMARIAQQDATRVAWGGTPGYAAPEQILEPESNDHRSDLYAVGALLYGLLSGGRIPYDTALSGEVVRNPRAMIKAYQAIAQGEVKWEPPTKGHPAIMAVLQRALAPLPAERLASAAQMGAALREALEGAELGVAVTTQSLGELAPPQAALPFTQNAQPTALLAEPGPPAVAAPQPVAVVQPEPTGGLADARSHQLEPSAEEPPVLPTTAGPLVQPSPVQPAGARRALWAVGAVLAVFAVGAGAYSLGVFESTAPMVSSSASVAPVAPTTSARPVPEAEPLPLHFPGDLTVGEDGAIYVADQGSHRIQLIREGKTTTLAGSSIEGFDDGEAADARFNRPSSVALAADATVIVADRGNHRIRAIAKGKVRTIAGGFEGTHVDGAVTEARFQLPEAVAVGPNGAIYVADAGNHCIRKIADGQITTIAGGTQPGSNDGPALAARFKLPARLALGPSGALYISDAGNRSIRVLQEGQVRTVVRLEGAAPLEEEATSSRYVPRPGIALLDDEQLVVADPLTRRIYQVREDRLQPLAGSGKEGTRDDYSPKAEFTSPAGVSLGHEGELLISDLLQGAVRGIRNGKVRTLVSGPPGGYADGAASQAQFQHPWAIALGENGELFIADWNNRRVRSIAESTVTTLAGSGERGRYDGPSTDAQFGAPWDVAAHQAAVYVADGPNHLIRVITTGKVDTFAGTGRAGAINGPAAVASFRFPEGIDVGPDGVLYVADTGNHLIRAVDQGVVRTLAGTGQSGLTNGDAAQAAFDNPGAVAVAADGAVYVADAGNHCIRRIHQGRVGTLAGTGEPGFADGQQAEAQFESPIGIAVAASGSIYVADSGNNRIRLVENGLVRTIAGSGLPGMQNGPALEAMFAQPAGVEIHADGTVYVADTVNHLIRVLSKGRVTTLAGH